jgi:hypothetical protein
MRILSTSPMGLVDGSSIIEGTAMTAKRLYAGPQQRSSEGQVSDSRPGGCCVGLLIEPWGIKWRPMINERRSIADIVCLFAPSMERKVYVQDLANFDAINLDRGLVRQILTAIEGAQCS